MKAVKRRLSYSRRPSATNVTISPSASAHPWEEDREKVLSVGASFSVKYLASKEVSQPRGVRVCENAVKATPYRKGKKKMTLTISKGGIRIVDDTTKMLAVDQPINKISFCSPDPNNPRIFSYIARDGVTRRWMCHVFVAVKGLTGERLSHALGCAFAACLREKEKNQERSAKKAEESTTVQLENVHTDTSQQQNVDWLRKQHMMRRQMSSSPSPPHSSTSSSPEFQTRTVQGWQEKDDTISFEEELDNILHYTTAQQTTQSLSVSPSPTLESGSDQVDFDTIKMGLSSQLKGSMSDSFLLNDSRTHASSQDAAASSNKQHSNKRSSVIATNDPWQSVPQTTTKKVRDNNLLPNSSPTDPWAFTNATLSSNVREGTENQVVIDPWSSFVKRSSVAAKLPSTNPWANDVGNVDIVQSIAPASIANGSLDIKSAMSKELNLFDPLNASQNEATSSTQKSQDSSDLFGNWDTAVRQMYQSSSYNSAQRHSNPWSQNQAAPTGTFVTPSLI